MKIKWWEWINRVLSSYIERCSKCRVMPFSKARLWKKGVAVFTVFCHLVMVSGVAMIFTIAVPTPAYAATEDVSLIRAGQTITDIVRSGDGVGGSIDTVTVTLDPAGYPNSNLKVGQSIVIDTDTDNGGTASFEGTFTIVSVASQTSFTYNQDGANETGTLGTVDPFAGGDYTTLTAWESGEGGNLTAEGVDPLNKIAIAECYDDWANGLSDAVTIDENTTDATHYMKVTVAQTDRHDGTAGTGFKIDPAGGFLSPPGLTGWFYRKQITIDNTNVDSDLTDFPLYVELSGDTDIGTNTRTDGYDIRFTQSDGTTELSYEREYFTNSSSTSADADFWVKIPTVTAASATTIYIYYGKSDATDGEDALNVWDTSYLGVWHMNNPDGWDGTADEVNDSAGSNDGQREGTATTTATDAKIYRSGTFDKTLGDAINITGISSTSGTYTFSMWLRPTTTAIYCMDAGSPRFIPTTLGGTNSLGYWDGSFKTFSTGNVPAGQWSYTAIVFNGGTGTGYVNGSQTGSSKSYSAKDIGGSTRIGGYYSGGGHYDGIMDEFRITTDVRTPAEIKFEWYNMTDAATSGSTDDYELGWGGEIANVTNSPFTVSDSYTKIEHVEITGWVGTGVEAIEVSDAVQSVAGVILSELVIHDGVNGAVGVSGTADDTFTIYNSVIYDLADGIGIDSNGADAIYNTTVYDCGTANSIDLNASTTVRNTYAGGGSGTNFNGTPDAGSSNNASGDATAPGANSHTSEGSANFVSVTNGLEDFHLQSTATNLIDGGYDLSGTFEDDIEGVRRSSKADISYWDIGASEQHLVWAGGSLNRTGGTLTESGGYTTHTFNSSGTFSVINNGGDVEVLVVAGGGGGGKRIDGAAGGGGAGGLVYNNSYAVTVGSYTVTVGSGGNGATSDNTTGSNGIDSSFDTITSIGGGGGGGNMGAVGNAGGSGGAGSQASADGAGGDGTAGQGNDGGDSNGSNLNSAPGGGGAGGVGGDVPSTNNGGDGGVGLENSISGTATFYAAGGGGQKYGSGTPGSGGSGGGGDGGNSGTANTGGGGGGGGGGSDVNGGNGGSGVVIIRYLTISGGDGDWSVDVNWAGGVAPGVGDVVVFNSSSTEDCTVDAVAGTFESVQLLYGYTGTVTLDTDIDIVMGGDFVIAEDDATFTAGANDITLGGKWRNSAGGTFTAPTTPSVVTFNGADQSITGSNTFFNLTKSVTSADTLTFDNTATQTISGLLTLTGVNLQLLSLRSDYPTPLVEQWGLTANGTFAVDYVDVQDSDALAGGGSAITNTNTTNSGNNLNWGASPTITDFTWTEGVETADETLTLNFDDIMSAFGGTGDYTVAWDADGVLGGDRQDATTAPTAVAFGVTNDIINLTIPDQSLQTDYGTSGVFRVTVNGTNVYNAWGNGPSPNTAATTAPLGGFDNVAPAISQGDISILAGGTALVNTVVDVAVAGPTDLASVVFTDAASGDVLYDLDTAVDVVFNDSGDGAPDATAGDNTWSGRFTVLDSVSTSGSADNAAYGIEVTLTDIAGNAQTVISTSTINVDNIVPVITDVNINITSTGSGTGVAYIIGDTITASWDNTVATGDANLDIFSVTVDFSAFEGGAAVIMTESPADIWTGSYLVESGTLDTTGLNVSVTATDDAGNANAPVSDTTGLDYDNVAPVVVDSDITVFI